MMVHVRKASYHGACLCDSHFSHLNRQVGIAVRDNFARVKRQVDGNLVKRQRDVRPLQCARDLAQLVQDKLPANINMVVFDSIDRRAELKPTVRAVTSIKKYHHFECLSANTIHMKVTSEDTKHFKFKFDKTAAD